MRRLIASPGFQKKARKFLKKHPDLERKLQETILRLQIQPADIMTKSHKLTGKLRMFYSCSINYEYRLVFSFNQDSLYLINIGTHDEVY